MIIRVPLSRSITLKEPEAKFIIIGERMHVDSLTYEELEEAAQFTAALMLKKSSPMFIKHLTKYLHDYDESGSATQQVVINKYAARFEVRQEKGDSK